MKLTTKQIALIDETLVLNTLTYSDIKYEVIDHIATEIETILSDKNIGFENALQIVFDKWNRQLKTTTLGFSVCYSLSGPKIAMDKMSRIVRNELKWALVFLVLIAASLTTLMYNFESTTPFIKTTRIALKVSLLAAFIIYVVGKILLFKSNFTTTFSKVYDRRFVLVVLYAVGFIFNILPILPDTTSSNRNIISLIFVFLYLFYSISSFVLLTKHYQLKAKYQIL